MYPVSMNISLIYKILHLPYINVGLRIMKLSSLIVNNWITSQETGQTLTFRVV